MTRLAARATRRGAPREARGSTGNCESTLAAETRRISFTERVEEAAVRATRRGAPREAWGSTGNCESTLAGDTRSISFTERVEEAAVRATRRRQSHPREA